MEAALGSSTTELNQAQGTPINAEATTPGSSPRRSLRTPKPSPSHGLSSCVAKSPKSINVISSKNENQKKIADKGWLLSTPTRTPKKLVETPDSKRSTSSLATTPQKDNDGFSGTPSVRTSIELDHSQGNAEETTPGSTPRRSLRKPKPSTPYGMSSSMASDESPKSIRIIGSKNGNQKKVADKGRVFSTPTTTPKKLAKTPDSKRSGTSSLATTPQKDNDSFPGTPSVHSSVIESDRSQKTLPNSEETTSESTPRRSLRTPKPSTSYRIPSSVVSKELPKSIDIVSSKNENQKTGDASDWVFSTPTTTPKKLAKTPDSKRSDSSALATTPQKVSDGFPETPNKQLKTDDSSNLGITPLNKTPNKTIDTLKWSGPSPYKSNRPKYLPKNIKLFKRKQLERQANLERLVKVDEQLLETTRTLSEDTSRHNEWIDSVSDPMGTFLPHTDVFSPQSYFVTFDELSLDVNGFVDPKSDFSSKSAADIVKCLRNGTLLISSSKEFRFCCYLLTVTTNSYIYYSILPLIKRRIGKDFFLGWDDLKAILVNFGLTLKTPEFITASNSLKTPPQKWNLEFLLILINNSFTIYKLSCIKRLLCFLTDSLFEPILLDLHMSVDKLVRRVIKHLLKKNVAVQDLVDLVNRSYLSSIHNRYIFQCLASDPELVSVARGLGIRTICDIAGMPYSNDLTHSQLMPLLYEKFDVIVKLNMKHIHQLLLISEKLFLLSGFDPRDIERLAAFAKKISSSYTHFDSLNLNVTVSRLETLASCSTF